MKGRDLFNVILKIFGIYMIKDVLLAILPVLKNFYQFLDVDPDIALFSLFFSFIVLALNFLIVYYLLFKTDFLITRLNLTSGLSDQPLILGLHRSQIYTIAILVTGLLILVFSIPTLIKYIYTWYDYMSSRGKMFGIRPYDYSGMVISITEVLIGFLFLGNQQALVNFIEHRKGKTKIDEPD